LILKAVGYSSCTVKEQANMALLESGQDQDRFSGETAWTVLDAAVDLGDSMTVDACRRVIDADLRGEAPARSDVAVLSAFFA
jgi:hypothetical protein